MTGICTKCNQPCEVIKVDFGIGPYEYWGARGIDTFIVAVSNCCEATATHANGWPVTLEELEEDSFDPPMEDEDD